MAYHRIIIDSERSLGTGVRVLMRREGVNYEVLQWSFQLWFGGHSDYTLDVTEMFPRPMEIDL